MSYKVYAYEKRITVKADGDMKVTHFTLSLDADDEEKDIQQKQVARSTYADAKRRGGYEYPVLVIVEDKVGVVRFPAVVKDKE